MPIYDNTMKGVAVASVGAGTVKAVRAEQPSSSGLPSCQGRQNEIDR
ncbi:MAG: hypothetical protein GH152_03325 [Dehalococcoidia bacterium]|nr:hypothetical protein [Dehalococcoidia bacterium]